MKFKLLVICGEPRGKCLLFPPGDFMIGRGSECHIRPNSDWVSRQHCMLRVSRSSALIKDLGSTNGTLVNGIRVVGERRLVDGDKVQLGPLVFEARLEESILVSKTVATQLAVPAGSDGRLSEAQRTSSDLRIPDGDSPGASDKETALAPGQDSAVVPEDRNATLELDRPRTAMQPVPSPSA